MNLSYLILAILLPSAMVLMATYLVLARTLSADEHRRNAELILKNKQTIVPMRLQAYERLILFLERISPDAMVMRLKDSIQTNSDLHLLLLQTLRAEYEHNLSQQLYVSTAIWEKIKDTKEDIARIINDCAHKHPANSPSIELAKSLFDALVELGEKPTQATINQLKDEAKTLF